MRDCKSNTTIHAFFTSDAGSTWQPALVDNEFLSVYAGETFVTTTCLNSTEIARDYAVSLVLPREGIYHAVLLVDAAQVADSWLRAVLPSNSAPTHSALPGISATTFLVVGSISGMAFATVGCTYFSHFRHVRRLLRLY